MFQHNYLKKLFFLCSTKCKRLFLFTLLSLFISGCGIGSDSTDTENEVNCDLDMPSPVLVYTGTEDYTVDSVEYTRYKLEVSNNTEFTDELFSSAPDLPPCGLNEESSRTWVDIYDNNDERLYGFCALGSSDDLNSIWFALPKGEAPPESAYITLEDRACENTYTSNSVNIAPVCYPDLPVPQLVFTGTEDYEVGGTEYTRYRLEVSNSTAFPNDLFTSSSDLPPCGLNTNSSRTWVDIYDNNDERLYGFCALGSSDDLNSIWFALPKGEAPPESVYIVLEDRACEDEYTSNSAILDISFVGNWLNEDPGTRGITRIEIKSGSNFSIHEWGACSPTDCDWGFEYTDASDAHDDILSLFWDQGFAERTQEIELVEPNRLKVTTDSHYIDDSGRPDVTHISYFNK